VLIGATTLGALLLNPQQRVCILIGLVPIVGRCHPHNTAGHLHAAAGTYKAVPATSSPASCPAATCMTPCNAHAKAQAVGRLLGVREVTVMVVCKLATATHMPRSSGKREGSVVSLDLCSLWGRPCCCAPTDAESRVPRPAPEEEDTITRLSTPCGAAVTTRLAQKMLADYCGKLPGCDRCASTIAIAHTHTHTHVCLLSHVAHGV